MTTVLTKKQLDDIRLVVKNGHTLHRSTVEMLIDTIDVLREEWVDVHLERFDRACARIDRIFGRGTPCPHPRDGKMCPNDMRLHHHPAGWPIRAE